MNARRALAAWCVCAAAGVAGVRAAEPPAAVALSDAAPFALLKRVPARIGGEKATIGVVVSEAGPDARRAAAAAWLDDAFAPLTDPACAVIAAADGAPPAPGDLAAAWPDTWPAGTADGRLMLPAALPPQVEGDVEYLQATGLIPFEVALTGEWMRASAARHAGPAAADPALRAARASRIEGAARLAGIVVGVRGTRIDPRELGKSLLGADADRAGWSRRALLGAVKGRVRRALLRGFVEDGLRWAAFHYLKGGMTAVAAALERPAVGPYEIANPGMPIAVPAGAPEGCRLGPRGAAAVVHAADDAWTDGLVADVFTAAPDGKLAGWFGFASPDAAGRAAAALAAAGGTAAQDGPVIRWHPR